MKLRGEVRLKWREKRDLHAPSKRIDPRLLHPLWEAAIRKSTEAIQEADGLNFLDSQGLAGDVDPGVYDYKVSRGFDSELRLERLRRMEHDVRRIDDETLPVEVEAHVS